MKFITKHLQTKRRRLALVGLGVASFFSVLIWSGLEAFTRHTEPVPLAAIQQDEVDPRVDLGERPAPRIVMQIETLIYEEVDVASDTPRRAAETATIKSLPPASPSGDPSIKLDRQGRAIYVNGKPWTGEVFDYKPIRKRYTRTMKTTAYSPDEKSCGIWADGITASGKSVWMNGGKLVAADRAIPYGTILTIPGYNGGKPVQVWDRGGKIKGNRLDVLYPTHEIALQWGVQDLPVVFWDFVEAD